MAMVRTMQTSVCEIYSYERTQSLYQQLYLIDLAFFINLDSMYANRW